MNVYSVQKIQHCLECVVTITVPVSQLTVEQAHEEFNSLADKIAAKYEQLDSSKFKAVGTPAFNAQSAKLASLFAHMSQLCQRLNLPKHKHNFTGYHSSNTEEYILDQKLYIRQVVMARVWRMQLHYIAL